MLKFDKDQRKALDKSKISRPMGKNRILAPYLDKAIQVMDYKWSFEYESKKGDSAWHPSGDCTPSVTDLYRRIEDWWDEYENPQHYTKKPPAGPQKAFMVGHYWHQLIQTVVVHEGLADKSAIERIESKWWGPTVEYDMSDFYYCRLPQQLTEGKWDAVKADEFAKHIRGLPRTGTSPKEKAIDPLPFHWVRGQGDIVPLKTKDWEGLVDIKTMGGQAFRSPALPEAFAHKYICQINIYMDLFDIEQAMILGVNKDTPHDFKEILFVRNQDLIDAIYAKWKFVSESFDNERPPTVKDNEKYALPEIEEVNND